MVEACRERYLPIEARDKCCVVERVGPHDFDSDFAFREGIPAPVDCAHAALGNQGRD